MDYCIFLKLFNIDILCVCETGVLNHCGMCIAMLCNVDSIADVIGNKLYYLLLVHI